MADGSASAIATHLDGGGSSWAEAANGQKARVSKTAADGRSKAVSRGRIGAHATIAPAIVMAIIGTVTFSRAPEGLVV
ncbi:hypothetical protein BQ8794_50410 [Mesorhizobium prunaredense]|uniref:Uncharacterized protein n=1 Tax=Mesorhizobium prunaredense TaxID=1631249 RepID=A0A1R3VEJ2_9HYPH|nr:hypothetical protein BQ8794_50410 [Mesorhizobium prunaredense]